MTTQRPHKPYSHHRAIRLPIDLDRRGLLPPTTGQHTYERRVLDAELPHGPECPCLMCSDARVASGRRPLVEPDCPAYWELFGVPFVLSAGLGALGGIVAAIWLVLP